MPVFTYQALDVQQRRCDGTISADTPYLARQQLRSRGWGIVALGPVHPPSSRFSSWWRRRARRRAPAEIAELWRNLAVLLGAGVSLSEALQVCIRQRRGALQPVLREVDEAVRNGRSLTEALREHPGWFDPLAFALVQVGEASGSLPVVLEQLAEYQARSRATGQRLTSALLYPVILLLVGIGVVVFLMTYVIPQLVAVLADAGRPLPALTQMLKSASDFLVGYGLWLGAGVVAGVLALGSAARTERGRRVTERLLLGLPLVGDLLRKTWVARVSLMLFTLLRSDVRFSAALQQVRANLPQRLLADELLQLERSVEAGTGLADALRDSRILPPLVVHLLGVGQQSGELPRMLEQLRDSYEREVQVALGRFLAVLEPVLILILAAAVGVVVYATLLPILETTKVVQ